MLFDLIAGAFCLGADIVDTVAGEGTTDAVITTAVGVPLAAVAAASEEGAKRAQSNPMAIVGFSARAQLFAKLIDAKVKYRSMHFIDGRKTSYEFTGIIRNVKQSRHGTEYVVIEHFGRLDENNVESIEVYEVIKE